MILIRENVERKTSDPLVIASLKKDGFKEHKPVQGLQSENNPEERTGESLTEVKEPKKKRSTRKGGTEND